jgi:hypothetical protein
VAVSDEEAAGRGAAVSDGKGAVVSDGMVAGRTRGGAQKNSPVANSSIFMPDLISGFWGFIMIRKRNKESMAKTI